MATGAQRLEPVVSEEPATPLNIDKATLPSDHQSQTISGEVKEPEPEKNLPEKVDNMKAEDIAEKAILSEDEDKMETPSSENVNFLKDDMKTEVSENNSSVLLETTMESSSHVETVSKQSGCLPNSGEDLNIQIPAEEQSAGKIQLKKEEEAVEETCEITKQESEAQAADSSTKTEQNKENETPSECPSEKKDEDVGSSLFEGRVDDLCLEKSLAVSYEQNLDQNENATTNKDGTTRSSDFSTDVTVTSMETILPKDRNHDEKQIQAIEAAEMSTSEETNIFIVKESSKMTSENQSFESKYKIDNIQRSLELNAEKESRKTVEEGNKLEERSSISDINYDKESISHDYQNADNVDNSPSSSVDASKKVVENEIDIECVSATENIKAGNSDQDECIEKQLNSMQLKEESAIAKTNAKEDIMYGKEEEKAADLVHVKNDVENGDASEEIERRDTHKEENPHASTRDVSTPASASQSNIQANETRAEVKESNDFECEDQIFEPQNATQSTKPEIHEKEVNADDNLQAASTTTILKANLQIAAPEDKSLEEASGQALDGSLGQECNTLENQGRQSPEISEMVSDQTTSCDLSKDKLMFLPVSQASTEESPHKSEFEGKPKMVSDLALNYMVLQAKDSSFRPEVDNEKINGTCNLSSELQMASDSKKAEESPVENAPDVLPVVQTLFNKSLKQDEIPLDKEEKAKEQMYIEKTPNIKASSLSPDENIQEDCTSLQQEAKCENEEASDVVIEHHASDNDENTENILGDLPAAQTLVKESLQTDEVLIKEAENVAEPKLEEKARSNASVLELEEKNLAAGGINIKHEEVEVAMLDEASNLISGLPMISESQKPETESLRDEATDILPVVQALAEKSLQEGKISCNKDEEATKQLSALENAEEIKAIPDGSDARGEISNTLPVEQDLIEEGLQIHKLQSREDEIEFRKRQEEEAETEADGQEADTKGMQNVEAEAASIEETFDQVHELHTADERENDDEQSPTGETTDVLPVIQTLVKRSLQHDEAEGYEAQKTVVQKPEERLEESKIAGGTRSLEEQNKQSEGTSFPKFFDEGGNEKTDEEISTTLKQAMLPAVELLIKEKLQKDTIQNKECKGQIEDILEEKKTLREMEASEFSNNGKTCEARVLGENSAPISELLNAAESDNALKQKPQEEQMDASIIIQESVCKSLHNDGTECASLQTTAKPPVAEKISTNIENSTFPSDGKCQEHEIVEIAEASQSVSVISTLVESKETDKILTEDKTDNSAIVDTFAGERLVNNEIDNKESEMPAETIEEETTVPSFASEEGSVETKHINIQHWGEDVETKKQVEFIHEHSTVNGSDDDHNESPKEEKTDALSINETSQIEETQENLEKTTNPQSEVSQLANQMTTVQAIVTSLQQEVKDVSDKTAPRTEDGTQIKELEIVAEQSPEEKDNNKLVLEEDVATTEDQEKEGHSDGTLAGKNEVEETVQDNINLEETKLEEPSKASIVERKDLHGESTEVKTDNGEISAKYTSNELISEFTADDMSEMTKHVKEEQENNLESIFAMETTAEACLKKEVGRMSDQDTEFESMGTVDHSSNEDLPNSLKSSTETSILEDVEGSQPKLEEIVESKSEVRDATEVSESEILNQKKGPEESANTSCVALVPQEGGPPIDDSLPANEQREKFEDISGLCSDDQASITTDLSCKPDNESTNEDKIPEINIETFEKASIATVASAEEGLKDNTEETEFEKVEKTQGHDSKLNNFEASAENEPAESCNLEDVEGSKTKTEEISESKSEAKGATVVSESEILNQKKGTEESTDTSWVALVPQEVGRPTDDSLPDDKQGQKFEDISGLRSDDQVSTTTDVSCKPDNESSNEDKTPEINTETVEKASIATLASAEEGSKDNSEEIDFEEVEKANDHDSKIINFKASAENEPTESCNLEDVEGTQSKIEEMADSKSEVSGATEVSESEILNQKKGPEESIDTSRVALVPQELGPPVDDSLLDDEQGEKFENIPGLCSDAQVSKSTNLSCKPDNETSTEDKTPEINTQTVEKVSIATVASAEESLKDTTEETEFQEVEKANNHHSKINNFEAIAEDESAESCNLEDAKGSQPKNEETEESKFEVNGATEVSESKILNQKKGPEESINTSQVALVSQELGPPVYDSPPDDEQEEKFEHIPGLCTNDQVSITTDLSGKPDNESSNEDKTPDINTEKVEKASIATVASAEEGLKDNTEKTKFEEVEKANDHDSKQNNPEARAENEPAEGCSLEDDGKHEMEASIEVETVKRDLVATADENINRIINNSSEGNISSENVQKEDTTAEASSHTQPEEEMHNINYGETTLEAPDASEKSLSENTSHDETTESASQEDAATIMNGQSREMLREEVRIAHENENAGTSFLESEEAAKKLEESVQDINSKEEWKEEESLMPAHDSIENLTVNREVSGAQESRGMDKNIKEQEGKVDGAKNIDSLPIADVSIENIIHESKEKENLEHELFPSGSQNQSHDGNNTVEKDTISDREAEKDSVALEAIFVDNSIEEKEKIEDTIQNLELSSTAAIPIEKCIYVRRKQDELVDQSGSPKQSYEEYGTANTVTEANREAAEDEKEYTTEMQGTEALKAEEEPSNVAGIIGIKSDQDTGESIDTVNHHSHKDLQNSPESGAENTNTADVEGSQAKLDEILESDSKRKFSEVEDANEISESDILNQKSGPRESTGTSCMGLVLKEVGPPIDDPLPVDKPGEKFEEISGLCSDDQVFVTTDLSCKPENESQNKDRTPEINTETEQKASILTVTSAEEALKDDAEETKLEKVDEANNHESVIKNFKEIVEYEPVESHILVDEGRCEMEISIEEKTENKDLVAVDDENINNNSSQGGISSETDQKEDTTADASINSQKLEDKMCNLNYETTVGAFDANEKCSSENTSNDEATESTSQEDIATVKTKEQSIEMLSKEIGMANANETAEYSFQENEEAANKLEESIQNRNSKEEWKEEDSMVLEHDTIQNVTLNNEVHAKLEGKEGEGEAQELSKILVAGNKVENLEDNSSGTQLTETELNVENQNVNTNNADDDSTNDEFGIQEMPKGLEGEAAQDLHEVLVTDKNENIGEEDKNCGISELNTEDSTFHIKETQCNTNDEHPKEEEPKGPDCQGFAQELSYVSVQVTDQNLEEDKEKTKDECSIKEVRQKPEIQAFIEGPERLESTGAVQEHNNISVCIGKVENLGEEENKKLSKHKLDLVDNTYETKETHDSTKDKCLNEEVSMENDGKVSKHDLNNASVGPCEVENLKEKGEGDDRLSEPDINAESKIVGIEFKDDNTEDGSSNEVLKEPEGEGAAPELKQSVGLENIQEEGHDKNLGDPTLIANAGNQEVIIKDTFSDKEEYSPTEEVQKDRDGEGSIQRVNSVPLELDNEKSDEQEDKMCIKRELDAEKQIFEVNNTNESFNDQSTNEKQLEEEDKGAAQEPDKISLAVNTDENLNDDMIVENHNVSMYKANDDNTKDYSGIEEMPKRLEGGAVENLNKVLAADKAEKLGEEKEDKKSNDFELDSENNSSDMTEIHKHTNGESANEEVSAWLEGEGVPQELNNVSASFDKDENLGKEEDKDDKKFSELELNLLDKIPVIKETHKNTKDKCPKEVPEENDGEGSVPEPFEASVEALGVENFEDDRKEKKLRDADLNPESNFIGMKVTHDNSEDRSSNEEMHARLVDEGAAQELNLSIEHEKFEILEGDNTKTLVADTENQKVEIEDTFNNTKQESPKEEDTHSSFLSTEKDYQTGTSEKIETVLVDDRQAQILAIDTSTVTEASAEEREGENDLEAEKRIPEDIIEDKGIESAITETSSPECLGDSPKATAPSVTETNFSVSHTSNPALSPDIIISQQEYERVYEAPSLAFEEKMQETISGNEMKDICSTRPEKEDQETHEAENEKDHHRLQNENTPVSAQGQSHESSKAQEETRETQVAADEEKSNKTIDFCITQASEFEGAIPQSEANIRELATVTDTELASSEKTYENIAISNEAVLTAKLKDDESQNKGQGLGEEMLMKHGIETHEVDKLTQKNIQTHKLVFTETSDRNLQSLVGTTSPGTTVEDEMRNEASECKMEANEATKHEQVDQLEMSKNNGVRSEVEEDSIQDTEASSSSKVRLSDLLNESTRKETLQIAQHQLEEKKPTSDEEEDSHNKKLEAVQSKEEKTDEEKVDDEKGVEVGEQQEQEQEQEHDKENPKEESGSDAPVIVEASKEADLSKPAHKKSHNILSGVGSKVKHSIAKVKKAITGKSSSQKSASPK